VALAGAAVAALVLLLGGAAVVLARDGARRALIDVGLAPSLRLGIAARWAGVPAIGLALGAVLSAVVATGGGSASLSTLGWSWTVPYVAGFMATLVIARAFLQPPESLTE
jgi:hypothetical protein